MKTISIDSRVKIELIEKEDVGKELKWFGKLTEKDIGKRVFSSIKEIEEKDE